jgi:putative (di)nucleoside polyphosphate hydrolase
MATWQSLNTIMSNSSDLKKYRPNVAAIIVNDNGKILACHRADMEGIWQVPQGGINKTETAEEALLRELEEEIGTKEVDIIWKLPETLRYDWYEKNRNLGFDGQEQTYFLVRLHENAVINLNKSNPEFNKYKWMPTNEFLSCLSEFKKEVYTTAIKKMKDKFPNLF